VRKKKSKKLDRLGGEVGCGSACWRGNLGMVMKNDIFNIIRINAYIFVIPAIFIILMNGDRERKRRK
jgi:hypothetical protein